MQDVAPELYEAVRTVFIEKVEKDVYISAFLQKVQEGTAVFSNAQIYSKQLGESLSEALLEVLTEDALPDGKLYWNIADRVIRPMLNQNYELVNQAATEVQKLLDSTEKIGLGAVRAVRPDERIKGLLDNATVEGLTFEEMQNRIRAPVVNTTESFFDDFIRENANFRYRAGMNPQIIRIMTGKNPCKWCKALAGTYDYDNDFGYHGYIVSVGASVYQRHKNCHCQVFYRNNREHYLEGVHTKRVVYDADAISKRALLNLDVIKKKE